MNNNKYYQWWKDNKSFLSLIPAAIFLVVSMAFFVVGLKFENPIVLFGKDLSMWIAVSLSLSNTVIQIIGNEKEAEGMGMPLYVGWLASYALGIGTNIYGIMSIVSISNVYLEWIVACTLGTMIEVLPEKLFVQFLKELSKKNMKPVDFHKPSNQHQGHNKPWMEKYNKPAQVYPITNHGNQNSKHKNGDPRKVVSKIFYTPYTDQLKKK